MEVSEPNTQRFDVALELLREGSSFTFDGVSFWIAPDGLLHVNVDSSWRIENITEQTALNDLERAKDVFAYLVRKSPSFARIVEGCHQQYHFGYDAGKSGVELARLVDGKLDWVKGTPLP
ncbi:MAG: hypothetical protein ACR2LC_06915 [Pyrinomonadaceae bacterium]